MDPIELLASSLGKRDEQPNIDLAQKIVKTKDANAIKELVTNLNNKKKDIQSDCVKVLYEIGTLSPQLIAPYLKDFAALLAHKNNRLQWGAMTAIDTLTPENPDGVYKLLPQLVAAADSGSVITKDHLVGILIQLGGIKKYANDAFALLIEQLHTSPTNQLPSYAEKALPLITAGNKDTFISVLQSRIDEIEKDTKKKRVEKVIQKAGKIK